MQILIPLITILGLPLGILLKKLCQEEIRGLKSNLLFAQKMLLITLIGTIAYLSFTNNLTFYLTLIIGLIVGYFFTKRYLYFGLASLTFNPLIGILIFIYSLPEGTLKPELKYNIPLFIIPFIFLLTTINLTYTSTFALGALITMFIKDIKIN